jgi:thiol-disulfide isomerase/thioredoxin
MLSIALGPIVISISQLITLSGLVVFWGLTYLQTRNNAQQKEILDHIFTAIFTGFITARLAFILTMWQAYQENWWQLLNISDGGFLSGYGWAAGTLVLIRFTISNKSLVKIYITSAAITASCLIIPIFSAALYQSGIELPRSQLSNMQGQEVNLSAYKGKPIIINFWATWCPPCRREMPVLDAAQKTHKDTVFIFVNQGESPATVEQFITSTQLDIQNIFFDPSSNVSQESGAVGLPTTLFYNAEGKLVTSHTGELSQASLDYYLKKHLK